MENIKENVEKILEELSLGNVYNEKITLVGASKLQPPSVINAAIEAGLKDIGENFVQEFKEKYDSVNGANRHFIGHLQTNKVKYLIGKTYLYQSVDRDSLAKEISARSVGAKVTSNVLIQINIGNEESKGGFSLSEGEAAYRRIKELPSINVKGFMAMLPAVGEESYLISLVEKMRALYDKVKSDDGNIEYLSVGMSGDYKLCIAHGSNMVRIGTALFGKRNYK